MSRVLPVAVIQAAPLTASTAIAEFANALRQMKADFPRTMLVACPELHLCGMADNGQDDTQQLQGMAEILDGPRSQELAALASELGVWLLPGSVCERGEGGELFNTAPAYAPDGQLVSWYRKIFPWKPFEPYDSGRHFKVFDIPNIGRIGLAICYDLWFPEVARNLAWMGAEVIIIPTQTTTCDREQEIVMARATAIQNQVYIVSVNAAYPPGVGRSLIVDPEGIVRHQAPDASPSILTDVLDLDAVTRTRKYGTCGLNRIWSQMQDEETSIALPIYQGTIRPDRWVPSCQHASQGRE